MERENEAVAEERLQEDEVERFAPREVHVDDVEAQPREAVGERRAVA
ncbi:hypothetical protein GGQ59_001617 [Parvularcula dongshanensis]|uniref:Uncharacterized protein n=1 Tax=Parvularcula dongshanensis TaxID=1173995 RepID=A0A840I434_9PROT|nr:hypothetical protein [Parvularcula dongshanensis]